MSPVSHSRATRALLVAASAILLAAGALICSTRPSKSYEEAHDVVLSTSKTLLNQPLVYPTGAPAKLTASIITMQPGEERGWHKHEVPLFGYILDGELTIDLGPHGTHVFKKGEAFLEAIDTAHNGRNLGNSAVRILAVFLGADGVPNTTMVAEPR